jgi:ABC-type multidrug transport system permease subunit
MVSRARRHAETLCALVRLQLRVSRAQLPARTVFALAPLGIAAAAAPTVAPALLPRLFLGMAVLSALIGVTRQVALDVAADRLLGRTALLEALGVTREQHLAAHLAGALPALAVPALLVLAARAMHAELAPASLAGAVPALAALALLAGVSFAAFGAWIGYASRSLATANLAATMIVTASLALCPVAYAADRVPAWLSPLRFLPPSLAAEILSAAWAGRSARGLEWGLLLAWTAIAAVAAHRAATLPASAPG